MITLDRVTKRYKGLTAVNQLKLEVKKGEIYGLLGSNGAGKSTTLQLLLGFIDPDEGSALINTTECHIYPEMVRKWIGYIPEQVNLYPYLTGKENLEYFCTLAGIRLSKAEAERILLDCGLQLDAHNKEVRTYSKGMRQKVGIAIAYAKKAQVYLLDEPASGLDPVASNELSTIMKKLANEGAAILMASHDLFRVRETCNRIGILKHGNMVAEMDSSSVTANELEQIYLKYMQD